MKELQCKGRVEGEGGGWEKEEGSRDAQTLRGSTHPIRSDRNKRAEANSTCQEADSRTGMLTAPAAEPIRRKEKGMGETGRGARAEDGRRSHGTRQKTGGRHETWIG